MAQRFKRLPAMRETGVQSLDWEDPLEKKMATQPSILAWKILWTEEPGRLQPMGSDTTYNLSTKPPHTSFNIVPLFQKVTHALHHSMQDLGQ